MCRSRFLALTACLLLTTAGSVCLAPVATAAEESSYRLSEIVVTATKTEHPVDDAPIPTQVIGQAEIERTSSDNPEAVLDEIPDLYVRRNDEFRLGASTVRMQGADANKVAILLDGRRFLGGVDGVVDLRDIPAQMIERIEIIRGPSSSLYGSDAMAGVINIITKRGREEPTGDATLAGGTYGRLLASASHGYKIGDLGYFLSYQHDEVELAQVYGAISNQFAGSDSDAKQVRDNVYADLRYDVSPSNRAGVIVNYNPIEEGPDSDKQNLTTGASWDWQPAGDWSAHLRVNRYGFERHNDLVGFEESVDYADWSGETLANYSGGHSFFGEQHLVTIGHRVRSEAIDLAAHQLGLGATAFEIPGVHESAIHNSPYLQNEISIGESWSVVIGSSVDVHQYFGATASPRLSLSWRPDERWRLTATVGRGYRAPDLLQLFDVDANNIVVVRDRVTGYVILGNRDLNPETDLGSSLQVEARPIAGLSARLQLYRHDFRDLIAVSLACAGAGNCVPGFESPFPELQGQIFRYENVGSAITQGVDIGFHIDPITLLGYRAGEHRLRVNLNYGFLSARNTSNRPGEGDELPFRPPHRVLAALEYGRSDLGTQGKFWGEYEDRTYTDITNSAGFIAESHWLWNLRLETTPAKLFKSVSPGGVAGSVYEGLSAFVEITNLLDTEFGIPTPMGRVAGRRMILSGVQYSWEPR